LPSRWKDRVPAGVFSGRKGIVAESYVQGSWMRNRDHIDVWCNPLINAQATTKRLRRFGSMLMSGDFQTAYDRFHVVSPSREQLAIVFSIRKVYPLMLPKPVE
jgi:hypothetical protein